ncbi:transposase [Anoxybacillus ayderensis]|nr:transposase [Anoxybacillus ayderensis]
MKRLKITNDHGWTPRTLRKQERKIKDASFRVRVTAVRLVMEGFLGKDVAKMVNLCHQSVSLYVERFSEGGLDHLLDRRLPPGRVPFLTEEQQQELRQLVLTTTPVDVGWGISSSWNTRILQSYIQQTYGVSMSREGIRKLLHRLRLSWTRPTYKLVKGDPVLQAAFEKELEFIKKRASYDMGRSRESKTSTKLRSPRPRVHFWCRRRATRRCRVSSCIICQC